MAISSPIEWTESTWNPVTGCSKISPGCKHCYAERMAMRLKAMGQRNYASGFKLTLQPHMLELPLHWKKPLVIFVSPIAPINAGRMMARSGKMMPLSSSRFRRSGRIRRFSTEKYYSELVLRRQNMQLCRHAADT
jgi:hypothetical protein